MTTQLLMHKLIDSAVVFAADMLMPTMVFIFAVAVVLRVLIYVTVKREEWFTKEFAKRVKKYLEKRDEKAEVSFYVVCKRLLEITYYEIFEIRSILKRRNPDAIMTLTDRFFLVQQGVARIVSDTCAQLKFLKFNDERPKFVEISNNTFRNNKCFNSVFGIIPISASNDFLNILPGLFIVGGIFGTFLGIMKALPELGGMNLADIESTKLIMDEFLLKVSFSMSTSSLGIILSVIVTLLNTGLSCEKVYVSTVERFQTDLDTLWNLSSSNKLPSQIDNFEADRDPIEVLAEDIIAKEIKVEVGFITLVKPIGKWWNDRHSKKSSNHESPSSETKNAA